MSKIVAPAGWYFVKGDPAGTARCWDGVQWSSDPETAPEGVLVQTQVDLGAFWARVAAWFLDELIFGFLYTVFSFAAMAGVFTVLEYRPQPHDKPFNGMLWITGMILIVVFVLRFYFKSLYCYLFLKKYGATPGKLALNLKVVRSNGLKLSRSDALSRAVAENILMVFWSTYFIIAWVSGLEIQIDTLLVLAQLFALVIFVANVLLYFIDDRHQLVHDKFAKTIVVKV